MLRKVCPCSGCGINTMCVSHDTFSFYCNRCLPFYIRGNFYEAQEEPVVEEKSTAKKSSKKS